MKDELERQCKGQKMEDILRNVTPNERFLLYTIRDRQFRISVGHIFREQRWNDNKIWEFPTKTADVMNMMYRYSTMDSLNVLNYCSDNGYMVPEFMRQYEEKIHPVIYK